MKSKFALFAIAGISLFRVASANSLCSTESLASYIALGSAGCTIGSDTFASFTIISPGTFGATAIDPTVVTVTPSGGTTNPTLTFATSLTAQTGQLLEAIFNYTAAGASFTSDMLTLSNSSETVDGAVTDIQNYCFGGNFGPDGVDGCPGADVTGTLLGLDGIQNTDQTPIAGVTPLGITDDFTLDGGTAGSATGGTFADQYTANANASSTPEPGAFLLTALGLSLAAISLAATRKIRRNRHA
jgi:hypothetical protein